MEKKDNNKEQNNQISLKFIVITKPYVVEKVNVNQPLSVPLEKALTETGNADARPITDWVLISDGNTLSIDRKVGDQGLVNNSVITVTLKAGHGG